MRFRRRIVLLASGWVLVSALATGLIVGAVGERSLADAKEELRESLVDVESKEFAFMWERDMADLHNRLMELLRVLGETEEQTAQLPMGRSVARRSAAEAVHNRVRPRMPPEDNSRIFYVLRGVDSTFVVADSVHRLGERDPTVAAVVNEAVCSPDLDPLPVITLDEDSFIWASCRTEGLVAIVGRRLAELQTVQAVANGEDLRLLGSAGSGTPVPVFEPQQDSTRAASLEIDVADVRWLGWEGDSATAVRGRLLVGRPEPAVAMEGPWTAVAVVVLVSLATAALVMRYVAAWMARPIEVMAHDASIVSLRLGRVRRSFRSQSGGPELKRLAAALNKMLDRIMEDGRIRLTQMRLEGREEMAWYVSHDVGNGLSVIERTLSYLKRASLNGPAELAREYQKYSEPLGNGIVQIGKVAKLCAREHKNLGARKRPTNMLDVIRREVEWRQGIDGVSVRESGDSADCWVLMDEVSLRRVVGNLIDNAAAAVTGTGGCVRVRCEETCNADADAKPLGRLIIEDDGPGFPADLRHRVFGLGADNREEAGGLGLRIVRLLVHDVDGNIRLEANQGGGTRIVVELERAVSPTA